MPAQNGPFQSAHRLAQQIRLNVANELREARIAAGLSQDRIARASGASRSYISHVETGRVTTLKLDQLARHATAVGLRPSLKFYPIGGGLRDAGQVRYIAKFVERVGKSWRVGLDVPIPVAGDLRAIDVVLDGVCVIAVEVVSRLRDIQAILRASQLKQRDFGATRLIIVVSGSHANRRALADARQALLATFDLDTQRVLAALASGKDPGRDAIVVLD
jgi:transcriptional regulator with XRE-family HTH domain